MDLASCLFKLFFDTLRPFFLLVKLRGIVVNVSLILIVEQSYLMLLPPPIFQVFLMQLIISIIRCLEFLLKALTFFFNKLRARIELLRLSLSLKSLAFLLQSCNLGLQFVLLLLMILDEVYDLLLFGYDLCNSSVLHLL